MATSYTFDDRMFVKYSMASTMFPLSFPSVAERSGTAPRKPGGYWSELVETRLGGGDGVVMVSDEAAEVEGSAEISAVGRDRVAETKGRIGRRVLRLWGPPER